MQEKMQAEPLSQVVFGQVPYCSHKRLQCDPDAHVTCHSPQLPPSLQLKLQVEPRGQVTLAALQVALIRLGALNERFFRFLRRHSSSCIADPRAADGERLRVLRTRQT
jgi:hypothetical protein